MSQKLTLAGLGITPEVSPEALVECVKVLNDLVAQIRGASESLSTIEKAVSDEVLTYENLKAQAEELDAKVREIVFTEIDDNPMLGVHLHRLLTSLADAVKDESDYAIQIEANKRKPKSFDGETQELIALAERVKNHADGLIVGIESFEMEFPTDGIEWVKTKGGKQKVKLPNVPKSVRSGGGRKSKTSQLVYTWNGTVLDTSLVAEIVRQHVNSGTVRFSSSAVIKQINAHDFSNAGTLSISFSTGELLVSLPEKGENEENEES